MEQFNMHPDTMKQIDTQRHRDALRRAAKWQQARAASGPGLVAQPARWLLCQLGHQMVKLGRRLERNEATQTV